MTFSFNLNGLKTGINGLDQLFAGEKGNGEGALPFNSLLIIEEDTLSIYTDLLVKCLSSSCLYQKSQLLLCYPCKSYFSLTLSPNEIIQKLPSKAFFSQNKFKKAQNEMKIAFRYQSLKNVEQNVGYQMDFSLAITEQDMFKNGFSSSNIEICTLENIENKLKNEKLLQDCNKKLCSRLVIINNATLPCSFLDDTNIAKFVYQMKHFSRQLKRTCIIITLNYKILSAKSRKRIHNIADSVLELVSFDPLKPSIYSHNYKGVINVHKLVKNSSAGHIISGHTCDLGFQLKKHNRYFCIDKLCLPPNSAQNTLQNQNVNVINKLNF